MKQMENMENKDKETLQIIKKTIYSKGFDSLINKNNISKSKRSSVIGIGGSHIYFSLLEGLTIVKSYKESIDFKDKENFFENIIYLYKNKDFQSSNTSVIFSYPFLPYKKGDLIDGKYMKNTKITKVLPFADETFTLSEKLNHNFNILNDAVAVNLYNLYKNKDYDIHIAAIAGTGVNISYTKNNEILNSEFGNIKIPESMNMEDILKIYKDATFEKVITEHSLKKTARLHKIDLDYLKKISAKIFALAILSFIEDTKSASILFQGSFICKDKKYRDHVVRIIHKYYKGKLHINYNNLSDIKGASLI